MISPPKLTRCLSMTLLLLLCLLSGCDRDNTDSTPANDAPRLDTGDLDAIIKRGTLRILAPRFDGADALPRDDIPVEAYQRMAEAFAEELQVNVQWIFIDEFNELIPRLQRGEGDLIVTNLTNTPERRNQVAFSRPINMVDEVVITPREVSVADPPALSQLTLALAAGTAYFETLARLGEKTQLTFPVETLDSAVSDNDLLVGISEGRYQATVMDSNIANTLLLDYPQLHQAMTLRKHRAISWAVRKDNTLLLTRLNQFLVSHHLQAAGNEEQHRDWEGILKHGRLRMLTLNNAASYFMWRGELMGFDYDLLQKFAKQHKLHLTIIMKNNIGELIDALKRGEGDVIAASLTQSQQREDMGLRFSRPYLKVSEQLIARSDAGPIESLAQLGQQPIGVNPETVFYPRLQALRQEYPNLNLQLHPGTATETLIEQLAQGEFYATVADSHLFAIEQTHRSDLVALLELNGESPIAWALRDDQPQLLQQLNQFIKKEYRGLFYNVTYEKYFKNSRKIESHLAQRLVPGEPLSPYDDIVRPMAKQYGMDWRMVVAQMYQESKFNPKARSFAGARGLMQVMPRTARELGFSNLQEPQNGIAAGLAYMHWLEQRFPGDIDMQERLLFTLAAYNAGAGHVQDARRLAAQQGLDPNRWYDNVERAMLLLSRAEHYKKARFGYVRGREPVNYVKNIHDRYLNYLQLQ
ncbi:membrane-bound lytic murein transglycosylase MltF [Pseudomaricurvus sp. HS19]|uniref:membrane-bound lytic murein transglycosylase MltF n=1 Tax=Pseudomaricurvus sp. HS19 TaxID=2692626 RepID=UPI00136C049F|nr:membrane-bound lytic murein transglycosylase MltF [Pseudomaricurvus sp. HS19]MYM64131.1 membrane-bound lytic murein transglycosylase MltF [Pseudomaricurvus sp. HS19]